MNFYSKIKNIQLYKKSMVCVGLDTISDDVDSYEKNIAIIDSTHDLVCAYKLNLAHYLYNGWKGIDSFSKTIEYIHNHCENTIVIADCKFGDIIDTNLVYMDSIFNTFQFDAVTLNPFCGISDLAPWFDFKDKGIFVWVSSTSDGRTDIQDVVFEKTVSSYTQEFSESNNLGFVIGADNFRQLYHVSFYSPDSVLLLPGIGHQGGDLSKIKYLNTTYGFHNTIIVNSGRQIIYSDNPREKTIGLLDQINAVLCRG